MKPNRFLRAAAVLLMLVIPSFSFFSVTLARYTTQGNTDSTARVATWNPTFSLEEGPGFNDVVLFTQHSTGNISTNFNMQNNSQVSGRYYSNLVLTFHANDEYVDWSVDNVVATSHEFLPHSALRIGRITYRHNAVEIEDDTAIERGIPRLSMNALQIN